MTSNNDHSAAELGQANPIHASERTPLMSELGRGPSTSHHEANPRKPTTSSSPSKRALSPRARKVTFAVAIVSCLAFSIALVRQVEAPPTPRPSKSRICPGKANGEKKVESMNTRPNKAPYSSSITSSHVKILTKESLSSLWPHLELLLQRRFAVQRSVWKVRQVHS